MVKNKVVFFLAVSIISFSISYGAVTNEQIQSLFPYQVNFTQKDLDYLRTLDKATLLKLVQVAKYAKTNPTTISAYKTSSVATSSTTALGNLLSSAAAGALSNGLTPIGAPPSGAGGPTYGANPSPYFLPRDVNPDYGGSRSPNPAADNPAAYRNMQPGLQPNSVDFSSLPDNPNVDCSGGGGAPAIPRTARPKLQFDIACVCRAFGQKIRNEGVTRNGSCHPGDQHSCGRAIDVKVNQFGGDRQKNAMLVVELIAMGYNIGSYQAGFGSFHADHEWAGGRWKTWSGVAHTNYSGGNARPYIQEVRDALSLIGYPTDSAASWGGNRPNKQQMMAAARKVIEQSGNERMKQCAQSNQPFD